MYPSQQNNAECCRNCRFSKNYDDECQCHRNAPRSDMENSSLCVFWPVVYPNDWCGEFEPKPTAVPPWHTNGVKK